MQLPFGVLRWSKTKLRSLQSPDEFTTVERHRSIGNGQLSGLDIDVIVVALKPDASTPEGASELVELIEVTVAHEVAPLRTTPRPTRLVDKDGHRHTLRREPSGNHHRQPVYRLAHSKM